MVVLLALAAGCGGGSSGPTEAEFVRHANAVCRDGSEKISLVRIPGRADVTSMPQAAAQVVALQRQELGRLRALKPPKKDKAAIESWIALVDQTLDQAELSARAQRAGDVSRALSANLNGAALDRRADELAGRFGLTTCIRATTAPPTTSTTRAGA